MKWKTGQRENESKKEIQSQDGGDTETACAEAFREKATDLILIFLAANPKTVMSHMSYDALKTTVGDCLFIRKFSWATFILTCLFVPCMTWYLKGNPLIDINGIIWFILRNGADSFCLFCQPPAPLIIAAIYWAVTRCQALYQVRHVLSHLFLITAFLNPKILWVLKGNIIKSELSKQLLWQGKHWVFFNKAKLYDPSGLQN